MLSLEESRLLEKGISKRFNYGVGKILTLVEVLGLTRGQEMSFKGMFKQHFFEVADEVWLELYLAKVVPMPHHPSTFSDDELDEDGSPTHEAWRTINA